MKFGIFPTDDAEGVILAHTVITPAQRFKKSHVLTRVDVGHLKEAGITEVMGARLEDGDVGEDTGAHRLASCVSGRNIELTKAFTGRCNLVAASDGLLVVNEAHVNDINNVNEALTLATLPQYSRVTAGQTVATAKIIPFACRETDLRAAENAAETARDTICIHPFKSKKITLISTRLSETKESVLRKSADILEERLRRCRNRLTDHVQCGHTVSALTRELQTALNSGTQLVLIFGASAITDRGDIIPSAIEQAGGSVDHLGMPVDPGNLLLLGHKGNIPIIGLPGCARSPKLNGFDWVLERLLADVSVTPSDIKGMGVGGLLKEIPTRPQPRDDMIERNDAPQIGAIILAAGQSSRMGAVNKLLEPVDGEPMVRCVARNVLDVGFDTVLVVTGHENERVQTILSDLPVAFARNPDYASGLSSSLSTGIKALQKTHPELDGVMVCLGDMPRITPTHLSSLKDAFDSSGNACIVIPTTNGKRGNPVLWSRDFFDEITTLKGDVGARSIIGQYPESIVDVDLKSDAIFLDVDTPEALQNLRDNR